MTPTTPQKKTVKAWAVVDRTLDVFWPNGNVGLNATFPTYRTAKTYNEENVSYDGKKQKIVKCTITYSLPKTRKKKLK